jgi:WD40 repeat protein
VGPDWVAAGGTPRELTVWDLTGGAARSFPVHEGPTTCLAGDDNGRIVTGGLDGRAVLTELASGQSGAIASGLGKIRSVALGPHSNCAVGCEDGAIAYWLTPVVPPIRLLAHREPVRILAMAPASGWLASGCDEGRICLWDISTGRLLGTALVAGSVTAMRPVSPDRLWVATSNAAVMVFQVITGG